MGKAKTKLKAKEKRRAREVFGREDATVIPFKKKFEAGRKPPPIMAMNARQAEYITCLKTYPQVFVLGPAGTGKTWIAASHAADLYRSGLISKIILTRPNVPCGRSLGFFPGTLESKFAPWTVPVTDAIRERLGTAIYELAVKHGDIEVVPFEVMRGRSWRDAFILLDEAQNTTEAEIKMFLTRIGEGCATVINGDIAQCDLSQGSGLHKAICLVRERKLPVPVVEFSADDIVRSGLCAMWVRAFEERPHARHAF
jgi:phosphate starvation-inducible PhoH-like protein